MDMEHMEMYANLSHSPHVLFTPSDLQYFVRDLPESSTVVNPGRITKVMVIKQFFSSLFDDFVML